MNDPKRWLTDGGAPEGTLEVLRALEVPAPPSLAKQAELARKLAMLAAPGAALPAAAVNIWLKLGLVCSAVIGGGILVAIEMATPAPPRPLEAVQIAPTATAPAPRVRDSLVAEPPADETRLDKSPLHAMPRKRQPPKALLSLDTLAEEEKLLEEARQLSGRAPSAAWRLLEKHRNRFPGGQLAAERIHLSIQVLQRLGKADAALVRAKRLTEEFPNSVYARQLLARTKEP